MAGIDVYLEVTKRRVFACSTDWPGLCRSGRDEEAALNALVEYGARYRKALGRAAEEFTPPKTVAGLRVVERVTGDATTEFGAPSITAAADERPVKSPDAKRLAAVMAASWKALDRGVAAAEGKELRKGPRGGGREAHAIALHCLEADKAYLPRLGGSYRKPSGTALAEETIAVRAVMLEGLAARCRGDAPPEGRKIWAPRYAARRVAWHALDHAWEIEDRLR